MTDLRTLPFVMLVSPMGVVIEAKWADDERGYEKSVQRDRYPLLHGETAIDFGGSADAYDMTLIFDGPLCDLAAAKFFEAAKQIGPWSVTHPVHGFVQLQLLSLRQRVTPVSSGGRWEIETHWMEPLDPLTMMTMRQLAGLVDAALAAVTTASVGSFSAVPMADYGSIGSVVQVANAASAAANAVAEQLYYIAAVSASLAIAKDQVADAQANLDAALASVQASTADYDPTTIANALVGLVQAPILSCADPTTAIRLMGTAVDNFITMIPSTTKREDLAKCATIEVLLDAALGGACLSVTMGGLDTRVQAVAAARALVQMLQDVTQAMDDVYDAFATAFRPDHRYYAQTDSYEKLSILVSNCVDYLFRLAFDLRVEKRIVLERDKTPIQICAEEYGAKAEDNLDAFIGWNQLTGDDVLILGQSREVVLYVETTRSA